MAYMNSEFYNLDNTQKFRVFSETGKGIDVEYHVKEPKVKEWKFIKRHYL